MDDYNNEQQALPPEAPSNQNVLRVIIFFLGPVILIFIVISGGIYFLVIKNKSRLNLQSNQALIKQIVSPTPQRNNSINSSSSADLSYIALVVNPSVHIRVTDSSGVFVGEENFSPPISNEGETLGTGVNEVSISEPISDAYTVILSSTTSSDYTFNVMLYDRNGNDKLEKFTDNIDPNKDHIFNIVFDKENIENSKVINISPP